MKTLFGTIIVLAVLTLHLSVVQASQPQQGSGGPTSEPSFPFEHLPSDLKGEVVKHLPTKELGRFGQASSPSKTLAQTSWGKRIVVIHSSKLTPDNINVFKEVGNLGLVVEEKIITDDTMLLIGQLINLKVLNLSNSEVTDDELSHLIGLFPNLEGLYVSSSKITTLNSLMSLKNLKRLSLTKANLAFNELESLKNLLNLEELSLFLESVSDDVITALRNLNLRHLEVASLNITNSGLKTIGENFPELISLHLSSPQITDDGFADLKGFNHLEQLELTSNKGFSDTGVRYLISSFPKLKTLDLTETEVTDNGLQVIIQGFPELRLLMLYNTKVTEGGVATLKTQRPRIIILK